MQSLCVCYYDAEVFANYSEADFARMGAICAPHDEALRLSGKVSLVGSLGMPNDFKTLRADKKGVQLEDGPYAPTAHPFGAFFIVEAGDIDEAVEVARLHPGSHLGDMCAGGIEVRPVNSLERLTPSPSR